ncbi:MAG: histidinol-phosphate transaminase [Pusillimonas sp.]
MSRFWSDHVVGLAPYVPGEQPKILDLLKLNTNEHPWGPSPLAIKAMHDAANEHLRLYPDPGSTALREALARHHGVQPRQVFVGNGSDEVLAHVFNGLFRHAGRPLLMPDITYSFYKTYCRLFDVPVELQPLAQDFSIDVADYTRQRDTLPAGIIFANPNAPTGIGMGLERIKDIAQANPDVVVVVDEAYVDFGADSAVSLLAGHENILVIHTFSKSRSLAGLRVGYAIGSVDVIEALVRVKDSFNSYPLDAIAQAGAIASIEDNDYFRRACQAIIDAREMLVADLVALGFEVLPSQANFVFARHPDHDAAELARGLRDSHILVRHFSQPRVNEFLRITVGTPEAGQRLCQVLATLL